jgi:hypothetical protein
MRALEASWTTPRRAPLGFCASRAVEKKTAKTGRKSLLRMVHLLASGMEEGWEPLGAWTAGLCSFDHVVRSRSSI